MATLKEIIIERANKNNIGDNAPSSNSLIRIFTNEIVNGGYGEKEIHDAQHHIKEVVKAEVVSDLDKQIDTFKHFLKQR